MGRSKHEQDSLPNLAVEIVSAKSDSRTASKAKQPAELQRAIDAFDAAFRTSYGAKPSWGAKQCGMMKRLVTAHGSDEVIVRINRLFAGALDWPRPPYDLGALVSHFDRLVGDARPRKLSPADIASGKWRA